MGGGDDTAVWHFSDVMAGDQDYYNGGGWCSSGNDELQLHFTDVELAALGLTKMQVEDFFAAANGGAVNFEDLHSSLTLFAKNFETVNVVVEITEPPPEPPVINNSSVEISLTGANLLADILHASTVEVVFSSDAGQDLIANMTPPANPGEDWALDLQSLFASTPAFDQEYSMTIVAVSDDGASDSALSDYQVSFHQGDGEQSITVQNDDWPGMIRITWSDDGSVTLEKLDNDGNILSIQTDFDGDGVADQRSVFETEEIQATISPHDSRISYTRYENEAQDQVFYEAFEDGSLKDFKFVDYDENGNKISEYRFDSTTDFSLGTLIKIAYNNQGIIESVERYNDDGSLSSLIQNEYNADGLLFK